MSQGVFVLLRKWHMAWAHDRVNSALQCFPFRTYSILVVTWLRRAAIGNVGRVHLNSGVGQLLEV
jgi:hypothetical protein